MSLEPPRNSFASLDGMVNLPPQIDASSAEYRKAPPFPHLILDNFFSSNILDPLIAEMSGLREDQWRTVESEARERVRRMRSYGDLGTAGTRLVNLLHCASFLYFLSAITGIRQLLPDPYLQGAGYASMQPGDYFGVHSDRNVAYETGLIRRLAMIVFLNKSWDSRYRGQLELWDADARHCKVSIDPIYNRTVIFEVAAPNFHGVPTPIACPLGRSRDSFIVYYHTVGTDGASDAVPHSSIFANDLNRGRVKLLALAREVTPPVLYQAAKRLVRRWKSNRADSATL
ncbi:MAG: 2OG-Fe(II) oxygenase [Proteobacteria bacterium]|nr:2OG-Fe(II) oxygenase [Pseudomonadota bacterium]